MPSTYNPLDWYWTVAWKLAGNAPTRIASADELAEVLGNASVRPALDKHASGQ